VTKLCIRSLVGLDVVTVMKLQVAVCSVVTPCTDVSRPRRPQLEC